MAVFFPDNQRRADRLMQLMNQCTVMQKTVSDEYQSIERAEEGMLNSLNEIMKQQGLATHDQLQKWIISLMPEDAQEEYRKVFEATKTLDNVSDTILMSNGIIFTMASAADVALNAMLYMRAAASMKIVHSFAMGIRVLVTQGVDAGLKVLNRLRPLLTSIAAQLKTTTTFGRVVGIVSTVAKVLDWVSLAATIITFIAQIIVEKQQRDELIKNIHEAVVNRINLSFFGGQLKKTTEHSNTMNTYLQMVAIHGKDNPTVQSMVGPIATQIQQSMDAVTVDGEIQSWATLDRNDGAYTTDDLPESELRERVEQMIKDFENEVSQVR